jgi:hypothetical protein
MPGNFHRHFFVQAFSSRYECAWRSFADSLGRQLQRNIAFP